MKICRRCVITGKVQGVFFRQGTKEQALSLHITGWVRNLSSGQVEAFICGEEANIERLCEWLREGPPAAKVQQLEIQAVPWQEYTTFEIQ